MPTNHVTVSSDVYMRISKDLNDDAMDVSISIFVVMVSEIDTKQGDWFSVSILDNSFPLVSRLFKRSIRNGG